jgi:hypothetical protein
VAASLSGSSVAEALGNAFRLNSDRHREGQEAFTASPFSRLLITHVLSLAGDALVTLALAGSLFFSTPLHAARGKVALTLLLTIAPFGVVAPLLGPIIDKTQGGRRAMVVATAIGRVIACFLMARYINSSLLLYPAAFLALVCSKGYSVAKSTLVPSAVQRPQDLVEANSKLAVSGAIAGFLIAIPGVALLKLANASWVLDFDILIFLACAATALRLQVTERRVTPAAGPPPRDDTEVIVDEGEMPSPAARQEIQARPLPDGAIQVAAFAMGTLRLIVGFLTFLVAFGFRHDKAPTWWYGVVLAASIGGNLVGAAVAPWLRIRLREELILAGSTVIVALAGLLSLFFGALHNRPAASLLAGVVGLTAGAAKLSFDALVQRHVPAASQGRAFGRFEAGFQLVWVLGGLVPVVIALSLPDGFLFVTVAAALAAVVFVLGTRMARIGQLPAWWPGVRPPARMPWSRKLRAGPAPASARSTGATSTGATSTAATSRGVTPTAATSADTGGARGAGGGSEWSRPPGATIPFASPDGATIPFGGSTPWVPPSDPAENRPEDMPWLDPEPPPDQGVYPPPIPGPPPLGRPARPVPPPLSGPPPRAAPLAPRPRPRPQPEPRPPGDGSVE